MLESTIVVSHFNMPSSVPNVYEILSEFLNIWTVFFLDFKLSLQTRFLYDVSFFVYEYIAICYKKNDKKKDDSLSLNEC